MSNHGANIDDPEMGEARAPARTYRVGELVRKPFVWLLGIIVAAFGASLTALLGGLLGNWFDTAKLSDAFASGQPVTLVAADESASPWGWATSRPLSPAEGAAMPDKYAMQTEQHDWMINHGGVNFIEDNVTLTIAGNRSDPVQITNISPHLEHCDPPLRGSILLSHPPAGGNTNVVLAVNLDSPTPVFKDGAESSPKSAPFFGGHSITLKRNEVMTLNISATSHTRTCPVGHRRRGNCRRPTANPDPGDCKSLDGHRPNVGTELRKLLR